MATQSAVHPRHPTHFEDLADTLPLFPYRPTEGLLKLYFATGVGTITQFIFQALEANRVARTIRQQARHKKAG